MIKVRKFLVENFLIEKLLGRISKGESLYKKQYFLMKICTEERQPQIPTHVLRGLPGARGGASQSSVNGW